MMKRFISAAFAFCICLSIAFPVQALVGQIDADDNFPFVVQIYSTYSDGQRFSCSASVSRGGLVSTAAHCVWRPEAGLTTGVDIVYVDADRRTHTVHDNKIFFPDAYKVAERKWAADHQDKSFLEAARHDIAFIVPDFLIEVEGYPHWGSELFEAPECYVTVDEIDSEHLPERCIGHYSERKMHDQLGDLNGVRVSVVGYGNFSCVDFNSREENCTSDGQRRFVELDLKPRITFQGEDFSPPELWCTAQNIEGINPIQHGDSGGPVFVKAKDGRWIFVGYTSGGSSAGGCASSILTHASLWQAAANYLLSIRKQLRGDGAKNWEAHQMRRLMEEAVDSWSLPTEEFVARLPRLYADSVQVNDINKDLQALQQMRRAFNDRWPQRAFTVDRSSITIESDSEGDPVASITANIGWKLSNPATGITSAGVTQIEQTIWYGRDNEELLASGPRTAWPQIEVEKYRRVSGDDFGFLDGNEDGAIAGAQSELWLHNGSTFRLDSAGAARRFYYVTPSPSMSFISPGTLLFEGKRSANTYNGTAYRFHPRCGTIGYPVHGEVSADQRQVTLFGKAPHRNSNCKIDSWNPDTLVFTFTGP